MSFATMFRQMPSRSIILTGNLRGASSMRMGIPSMVRAFHPPRPAVSIPRLSNNFGKTWSLGFMAGGSMLAGGAIAWATKPVECDAVMPEPPVPKPGTKAEAKSIVNVYQLTFGTICGICAGVFIKKGLKLIAVALGAAYVLLQYLASKRLVNINWQSMSSSYGREMERLAGPLDPSKSRFQQMPLVRIWNRLVEFLTSDFQERATFIAGLVLGLRLG
ncbi:Uncharacterized protein MSYG_3770 [Malassezia sympodialis ATCC 42132]|uniref:Uncharacterized protein n=1 Tax=Malassezia sympodialis (strain ATCC 42132) TaxID=1230383 RepID=A0A1M8AAF1_MALS4|nr:Uncharacterized protein MSYG_3770 [Malassezia sympodialis ATCC 42132]